MNPYGDIDLTRYLQTEGRRRAAALAKSRRNAPSGQADAQQQCAIPEQEQRHGKNPASLSEVLVQMGVTAAPRK